MGIFEMGSRSPDGELVAVTPCGACRQVIAEQSRLSATLYLYGPGGEAATRSIAELLPEPFDL
ncbi:hypothetical protein [Hydrogenimonas sp.]